MLWKQIESTALGICYSQNETQQPMQPFRSQKLTITKCNRASPRSSFIFLNDPVIDEHGPHQLKNTSTTIYQNNNVNFSFISMVWLSFSDLKPLKTHNIVFIYSLKFDLLKNKHCITINSNIHCIHDMRICNNSPMSRKYQIIYNWLYN